MYHSLCDDFFINYSRCVCVLCWAMFCFGFISLHKLCTRISFVSVSCALFYHRCLFAGSFFTLFLLIVLWNVAFTIAKKFCNIFSTIRCAHTHALTSRTFMICMLSYMCMESLSRKNTRKMRECTAKKGCKRLDEEAHRQELLQKKADARHKKVRSTSKNMHRKQQNIIIENSGKSNKNVFASELGSKIEEKKLVCTS